MSNKVHWHPAFYAAMELELKEDTAVLEYEREHLFSLEPLRADLLIIKKQPDVMLSNEIGAVFRTWNIVEYKSPTDSMNIDDFYKVCAYACLFKALSVRVDEYPAEEITVSMVRRSYPRELEAALARAGFTMKRIYDGIYEVQGNVMFCTQIVVTKQLDISRHAWLRSLTNDIRFTEFRELTDRIVKLQNKHEKECADAVLEVVTGANAGNVDRWKEDLEMCEALAKIMEPEFSRAREEARRQGLEQGLEQGRELGLEQGREQGIRLTKQVIKLDVEGYDPLQIAEKVGISEREVLSILA